MKVIHETIELLKIIRTFLARRKAAKQATRAAVRIALNGCRV